MTSCRWFTDPFIFDYEINCHSLTRPHAKEESLIVFFVTGAAAALILTLIVICAHHHSAAKKAATSKTVEVRVRRADGTVETYKKKMMTKEDRQARRKLRQKQAQEIAKGH